MENELRAESFSISMNPFKDLFTANERAAIDSISKYSHPVNIMYVDWNLDLIQFYTENYLASMFQSSTVSIWFHQNYTAVTSKINTVKYGVKNIIPWFLSVTHAFVHQGCTITCKPQQPIALKIEAL